MSTMRAIYGARKSAGLDDDTARDLYERETGKRHLTQMTPGEQVRVLQAINRSASPSAKPVGGPYAKKLQALWLDAWNLGIVRDRRDGAMLAFVARQTGIQRTEFLREAAAARKAVEGLKAWIARAAGLEWADHEDPMDAVIAAQVQKLGLGGVLDDAESRELQAYLAWRGGELPRAEKIWIMQLLGECIRKAAR